MIRMERARGDMASMCSFGRRNARENASARPLRRARGASTSQARISPVSNRLIGKTISAQRSARWRVAAKVIAGTMMVRPGPNDARAAM
jgi:hypothetical protein